MNRTLVVVVLSAWVAAVVGAESSIWETLIEPDRAVMSACRVPAHLDNRRVDELPAQRMRMVFRGGNPAVSDGCVVVVLSTVDTGNVYVSLRGGIDDHIQINLGPFRPDGTDF